MTSHTFNVMAFTLTIIIGVFLCVLALIVYLKGKKEYLNIAFALTLIFASLWIASGFIEGILVSPPSSFTLFTFQWAYAAGALAFLLYFLFLLGLFLARAPKKSLLITTMLVGDKHHPWIGLGLYSVRLIADLLQTEIPVTAAPDEGTKFSFDLPLLG